MISILPNFITWSIDKICAFSTKDKKELKEILSKIASFIFIPYRHDSPEDATESINRSPIALLKAQNQVVAFDESFRKKELEILSQFSEKSLQDGNIRLFVGPGGAGKTRLMIEWALRLQEKGWVTLFLLSGIGDSIESVCREIGNINRPLFIVIDYAECRPDLVAILRNLLVTTKGRKNPLRIALVARHADIWWDALKKDASISSLLDHAVVPLSEIEPGSRIEIYERALEIFQSQLNITVAEEMKRRNVAALQDPKNSVFQWVLYILMAAYATADGVEFTAESLLGDIVAMEKRFWLVHVNKKFNSGYEEEDFKKAASRVVSAVTLRGKVSMSEMPSLLEAVQGPSVPYFPEFLSRLYPSPFKPGEEIAGMEPDLLGEHLVWETLETLHKNNTPFTDIEFLRKTFDINENLDEIRQAFTILGRIAERPEAQPPEKHNIILEWLRAPLDEEHINIRCLPAVEAAISLGEKTAFCPIPDVLADALEKWDTPFLTFKIWSKLPKDTVAFRQLWLRVTETIVNDFKGEEYLTEEQIPIYASALSFYGMALGKFGRHEEALRVTLEAVEIRRRLANSHPETFLPDLAGSFNNLGLELSKLGQHKKALKAAQEAVKIQRRLIASNSDTFLPDLAMSFHNQGIWFIALGWRKKAVKATRKAVKIRRRLAPLRPDAFLPDLAVSLSNLGAMLSELGKNEEALEVARKAVKILRRLTASHSDAFLPSLAESLNNLGEVLSRIGQREKALKATREAVKIRRRLTSSCSNAFLSDLAMSLGNLGNRFRELERSEEALKAYSEAILIHWPLAQKSPHIFEERLFKNLLGKYLVMEKPEEMPPEEIVELAKLWLKYEEK